ncbi:long-chain fatty acid--CoA ligase [Streptomyces sp. NBC_00233]|uniref:long-chain-fatty-acid--CoA ligase n=1 Tax=Streptomyces sp. NBC_00233 TaxID=2975686 RepID=UPI00224CCE5F|nr:long-chain fatty acid--CoA ligase [Streptomyces sp. NBC_00233]MCX5232545.1 long-chain fatty acid--CoA ligase [Streptomyces sp. NBC_00233]
MLNLTALLENSARTFPDRTAVVLGVQRMTYAELDAASRRVADLLHARGIGPGDKVALSSPNVLWFPVVYFGILKAGAVVVPLNVLLKDREIAYLLADSRAKAYFCFEGGPELPLGREGWSGFNETPGCAHFFLMQAAASESSPIEGAETLTAALDGRSADFETVATEPDDTAVVLYTSGTTGRPKGAELTHSNVMMNVLTCHKLFGEVEHDVHLIALPLFHSFGQVVQMNAGLASGATLVLLPRFDAQAAVALMQRHAVTFFAGVPTMFWALLQAEVSDADLSRIAGNLRMAGSGGSALPVEIHRRFTERYGVTILEGYGLSETSPVATFAPRGEQVRPGSIGRPVWGVEVDLVREDWTPVRGADAIGEIVVRGHNVMKGYLNQPETTAEVMRDGWFRTGDLARRDADGWFYIVDRAKDMIIRGGFNVYPREVEEVLLTHPAVSMVAVVGVPDERHGEEIKACVVRAPEATLSDDELIGWCKERMAGYKYPRLVEFFGALPTNATGKILKRELRETGAADTCAGVVGGRIADLLEAN